MNTPVSFELAKLLKEKGFDEEIDTIYDSIGMTDDNYYLTPNSELVEGISAPTIAEVVMWLYEKHGVWISVQPISMHKWKFYLYTNSITSVQNISLVEANSPTEAYEAAIEYTLKNLITNN